MERLVLIEFIAADRPIRGIQFPYIHGFVKGRGLFSHWLRFGLAHASHQFVRGEHGIGLEPGDMAALLDYLDAFKPTRAVFNIAPSSDFLRQIGDRCPGLRTALAGTRGMGAADPGQGLETLFGTTLELTRFLGLPEVAGKPTSFMHEVTPDFGFLAMNPLARKIDPIPYVVLDSTCKYARGLRHNPLFLDIDLSGCDRTTGCTFCDISDDYRAGLTFTLENARMQFEALKHTLPPFDRPVQVRLIGDRLLDHAPNLVRIALDLDMPPCEWQFDTRADDLVRSRVRFEEALVLATGTGHRVRVTLLGIENFSRDELLRMNKGLTPQDNLDAIRCLVELGRDHPAVFGSMDGGCSTILFSPWTTLEDVAFNLRIIKEAGIFTLTGKLLGSRMRLIPGTPIAALAQHDGLTTAQFDDPLFESAMRNLYGQEIPWKFQDARADTLCRIFVRLDLGVNADTTDPLTRQVSRLLQGTGEDVSAILDIALSLVDALTKRCPPTEISLRAVPSASELLKHFQPVCGAHSGGDEHPDDVAAERPPVAWAASRPGWWHSHVRLLCATVNAGLKPVAKLEGVPRELIGRFATEFDMPNLMVVDSTMYPEGHPILYFGKDPESVQRLARLTQVRTGEAWSATARPRDTTGEIGALLGYPACCVKAFRTGSQRDVNRFIEMRLNDSERIPPERNPWPFSGISAVPCSPGCSVWLEGNQRMLNAAHAAFTDETFSLLEASMSHPWLLLPEFDSSIQMIPDDPVGPHFRFTLPGPDPHPLAMIGVLDADEIRMDDERTWLFHRGVKVADLSMRAFVWSHEKVFQRRLWQSVLDLRQMTRPLRDRAATAGASSRSVAEKLHGFVSQILARFEFRDTNGGGFRIGSIRAVADDSVHVALVSDHDTFTVVLRPRKATPKAFLNLGPLALLYPGDPADSTQERQQAIHELADRLAHGIAERRRDYR